jgi:archaeal flagellar protein FlaI
MEKIKAERGWDDERLVEELSARAATLRWMGENNVVDEARIKKTVEAFHRDRKGLMKFMKERPVFNGDIALGDYAYD